MTIIITQKKKGRTARDFFFCFLDREVRKVFKDYDKYLSTSLKVYIFVLVIVFIMKLGGIDYFGLEINNPIMIKLNNFCLKFNLMNIWYFITLYIYTWCILSVACNERKLKFKALIYTLET